MAKHGQVRLVLSSGIVFDALMASTSPGAAGLTSVIAERVKTLRTDARLSGTALAGAMNKLGIAWNRSTVAKLETGRRESITVQELLALAMVLEVPPPWLLVDPQRETVPIADGIEVNPWMALLWMIGAEPLRRSFSEPALASFDRERAPELIHHAEVLSVVFGHLLDSHAFRSAQGDQASVRDENDRKLLRSASRALQQIEQLGVRPPPVPAFVLERAQELDVELAGPGPGGQ